MTDLQAEIRKALSELLEQRQQPAVSLRVTLDEITAASELRPITAQQYDRSLRRFEEYLGRSATSHDLTHETLNDWMRWLQEVRQLSAVSIKNHRLGLVRIWNYLAADGALDAYNQRRLRNPRPKPKAVRSWTRDNLQALLKAAADMPGITRNCGIPDRLLYRAMLLVGYDSGLRPIDLLRLEWSHIDFEKRQATIVQSKTGNPHTFRLSLDSINALHRIREPERRLIFDVGKTGVCLKFRKLSKLAANYGFVRPKGEGLAMLRKLHATEVCREHGLNAAAESLGHVSGSGIAKRHYVDSSVQYVGKLPPALST